MDDQKMKTDLIDTFNTVSAGYDGSALRFFPDSAQHMAALLALQGTERVLDVACGTGNASLAIAPSLPKGRVTAVDFSSGMLNQARRKAAERGASNIDFIEGDMQALPVPDSGFDVAVCAFGIFFVRDMEAQLRHIAAKVRPNGRVMITNFEEAYFSPLKELFFARMEQYGVQSPPQAWKRISHEDGCRLLFEAAGLSGIRTARKNVGYHVDANDWWSVVWNAGLRRFVTQLPEQERERFKREHLEEVGRLGTEKGIWLDIGVLFTEGTKR